MYIEQLKDLFIGMKSTYEKAEQEALHQKRLMALQEKSELQLKLA